MTIDEVRRRARRELEEVLSVETADYLLDRPPGGWGDLATKSDLDQRFADSEKMLNAKISELRTEIAGVRAELRSEIAGVRAELRSEMAGLRSEIGSLEHRILSKIDERFAHQMRWFTTTMIGSMTGLVVAVVALVKI